MLNTGGGFVPLIPDINPFSVSLAVRYSAADVEAGTGAFPTDTVPLIVAAFTEFPSNVAAHDPATVLHFPIFHALMQNNPTKNNHSLSIALMTQFSQQGGEGRGRESAGSLKMGNLVQKKLVISRAQRRSRRYCIAFCICR